MNTAYVSQVKLLVRATSEALDNINKQDIVYKFGVQLALPTQGGLNMEQVKTCLRKLEEALGAFRPDSPIQFGLEVSHASEVDEQIIKEANRVFEAKASLQPKQELIVPETAVQRNG